MMKDKSGKILYIGKAKRLRSRVSSYFRPPGNRDAKTALMVSKIADVELIVTDSEIEALILEANLVKEHKPRYNVDLKDDKRFPYLKMTVKEAFPRLLFTRRVHRDGAKYFGPYTNVTAMRRTLKFLMRHFGLRSCNYELPPSKGKKYQVCLDYNIGRCAGACEELETEDDYKEHVDAVLMFLSGRRTDLINRLHEKMKKAAGDLKFEEAARLRDTIEAMESVRQKQKVDSAEDVDRDVIAFARDAGDATAVVMQIREGILIGRQDFQLSIDKTESDTELLSGFLKQYYNQAENLPAEVYIPIAVDDAALFERWLTGNKGSKVRLILPQKGEKVKLVAMAETNARLLLDELLLQKKKYETRVPQSSADLQKILGLDRAPLTVGCFDISNLGGSDKVASYVLFDRGKPKKSEYRRFRIKAVRGQDDFASMQEVVNRYVNRRLGEEKPLADLIMVDGGKGQLSVARQVLKTHGLDDHPVIGLAKRLEEVFAPGYSSPVNIPKDSAAINLLKKVRDEAHRFAITYHRKLRGKRSAGSELDKIPGVGENRRNALLKHFGSIKRIKEASPEEIASVKGIPGNIATKIYRHFNR